MSYMSVTHILKDLLACQLLFRRWADKQAAACSDPACEVLLGKIGQDARMREEALQEVLDRSSSEVLDTELQYESVADVQNVVDSLPPQLPNDPSAIMAPVSEYYTAVTETLRLAARESRGGSAKDLLNDLADDTAAIIANEAWAARDE